MKKINFKKIKRETQERMERYKVKKKVKKKDKVEKVKPERKRKRFRFWYWLTVLITFFAIILFVLGVGFCYYIVTSAPEFDKQQMFEKEVTSCVEASLVLPAYDYVLKCSHTFNLLDARGVISKDERINFINRIRRMAAMVAKLYVEQREKLGFPLLKK